MKDMITEILFQKNYLDIFIIKKKKLINKYNLIQNKKIKMVHSELI